MARHELSRTDARRIAVRAQWLHADRPTQILPLVHRLTLLQIDPTAAVAPSADLVLWSRLGSAYAPMELARLVREHTLVELRGMIRPADDIALYGAEMATWPGTGALRDRQEHQRDWVRANDACRRDLLKRLDASGPLRSRDLPDSCAVPWRSSGWTNNRNVTQLLDFMVRRGEVAVAGRAGKQRLWDVSERVYPDAPVVPAEAAALLSPFDGLLQDRKRMAELFEFDYILEMYKPAAKRRWGYYALPVLYGDRLVGKLDANADLDTGVLRVNALHWDVDTSKTLVAAVDREIDDLAGWLNLEPVRTY